MRNTLLLLPLILFWGATNLVAQTALEEGIDRLGIAIDLPSFMNPSQNSERIYVAEINEKNPIPEIAQTYGSKASFGDTYFNVLLGMVNSILTYKNGECVVFVYTPPGRGGNSFGKAIQDSTKIHTLNNISFERIKSNFKFGKPNRSPSELDTDELYSMLTHYPCAKAKQMFNANAMVSYPLNLRGNIYKNKYTRGRAVVAGKDYRQFYLYFMMTDESVLDFEKFLNDFEKVFWFKD